MSTFDLNALINKYNEEPEDAATEENTDAQETTETDQESQAQADTPTQEPEPRSEAEPVVSDATETAPEPEPDVVVGSKTDGEAPEPVTAAPVPGESDPAPTMVSTPQPVTTSEKPKPTPELAPLDLQIDKRALTAVNLGSSGMLVEFSVSQWGNRRADITARNKLAASVNADAKMVSVNKKLVDSPTLKALQKMVAAARQTIHYPLTLPWGDNGWRYLPGENLPQYIERMSEPEAEFDTLVQRFRGEYALLREEARVKLGDMFNPNVYPTVENVISRFRFRYTFVPVPERGDFRVALEQEQQQVMQEQYDKFYQEQITSAVTERWEAAREQIVWLIDRMTDTDDGKCKTFKESALQKAIAMIDLLDTFNLTNDATLAATASELRHTVRYLDAGSLRENEAMRRKTKERLDKALASLPTLGAH